MMRMSIKIELQLVFEEIDRLNGLLAQAEDKGQAENIVYYSAAVFVARRWLESLQRLEGDCND